jgi:ribosomal RNA-processing protein 36
LVEKWFAFSFIFGHDKLRTTTQIADKKKLLLKARYDAMAAEGGKKAVNKAIEKKRKKQSQSETKSRPFSRNTGSASTAMHPLSRKRKASGYQDTPARKHPKSS